MFFLGLAIAFILFTRLALRVRTIRSLQFQLSLFLIVWIISEGLRLLDFTGLISATADTRLLGLSIHTVSMVIFALFVVYRFSRTYEEWATRAQFQGVLHSSVDTALEEIFGRNTARTAKFYVDTRIVLKNPIEYTRSLERIFKEPGAKLIVQRICNKLGAIVGLEMSENVTLAQFVRAAAAKYQSIQQSTKART